MKRKIIPIVVIIAVVFTMVIAVAQTVQSKDNLTKKIKSSSSEELGYTAYSYAIKEIKIEDLTILAALLDNRDPIAFRNDPKDIVYVRDIALTFLEAITGKSFLPSKNVSFRVKAIFAYNPKVDIGIYRFHITALSDEDFKKIKPEVNRWIEDYKRKGGS